MKLPRKTVRGHKRRKYAKLNRRKPIAPPTLRYPDLKKEHAKRACRSRSGDSDAFCNNPSAL